MIIRHFSTSDAGGGAAVAANLLHQSLRRQGVQSYLHVRFKSSPLTDALQVPPRIVSPWPDRFRRTLKYFARPVLRAAPGLLPQIRELSPTYTYNLDDSPRVDLQSLLALPRTNTVLVFHWVSHFLDVRSIHLLASHFRGPIVQIIHDLDPLTGGCHYDFGCTGYQRQCGACPQLNSTNPGDHSHRTWMLKKALLTPLPVCFVATTSWGSRRVRESSLFGGHQVVNIPLPLPVETFRPFPRQTARELLQLPADRRIILAGSSYLDDPRKGTKLLIDALCRLPQHRRADILLLAVGLNGYPLLDSLPFQARYLGPLHDPLMMALAYQAADLFVCPSLADSGPMMIPEAMLCHTPVVAFNTGGAPDWINHLSTGYIAHPGDAADLANGISFIFDQQDAGVIPSMTAAARSTALALHHPDRVAQLHLQLYSDIIASSEPSAILKST